MQVINIEMSFISCSKLHLNLGDKTVLTDVNLELEKGSRCVLVGINGSGKSCLLRTISGKHIYSGGKLSIDGKIINFQTNTHDVRFLGDTWSRSVAFNGYSVAYSGDIKAENMMKTLQEEFPDRRHELMKVLGINPNWRMHMVSSGQRRRVRLFLGLLRPFKVALIDEMTMDLDIITRTRFMNWLKKETIDTGACIIYATHIFDGLDKWGTHLAHIKPGGILDGVYKIDEGSAIIDLAYEKLEKDYMYLERNDILEKEDGDATTEISNLIDKNQGGYSSGRSSNFC